MFGLIKQFEHRGRALPAAVALVIVAGVGSVDYATGWELSFSVFYLLAVGLATW